MRILHFGRFCPSSYGGIERQSGQLIAQLRKSVIVDNLVSAKNFTYQVIEQENGNLYKVPSLGIVASTSLCPTMPFVAKRLAKKFNYNLVHLHFPDPMSHLAYYFLPKKSKLVISWHSDIIRQRHLLKLYRPFLKQIVQRADAIIAATPKHFTSSKFLTQYCDPAKFFVVPYGMDYTPFKQPTAAVAAQNIKQQYLGKKLIFALGRHVYYKGFEYLIRAMQYIDNAVLLLAGKGPLTFHYLAIIQALNLSDKVVLVGALTDEELPKYYHAADVFCLPSIQPSEAFGLVQLEAMACKKPVISCQLNNGVDYVNQNQITGLTVQPRDPMALAQAVVGLLADKALCQKMGEAGYQRIDQEFSLENMNTQILKVYKPLIY